MARKKKKKRRLKKGAALVLKWSIAMIIIGTAAFFLMNMVYNRGIYVKTHPLVLDMEEDVSAEDFIETYDDTEVLVTFVDMPVHQIGKQTVEFVVENKKGRSKKYTQTLEWVHKDKTAPQINGVHNITVTIGDTVSYLDGVSAVDDVDGPVNVTVEKVSVNTRQTGTYPIAYLATDSAGNLAKVNASVTVVERAQDWQEAYALTVYWQRLQHRRCHSDKRQKPFLIMRITILRMRACALQMTGMRNGMQDFRILSRTARQAATAIRIMLLQMCCYSVPERKPCVWSGRTQGTAATTTGFCVMLGQAGIILMPHRFPTDLRVLC